MPSIKIWFLFLSVFLYGVKCLPECAEFDKIKKNSEPFEYRNQLEQLLGAFDQNDTQTMEDLFKFFETVATDEPDPIQLKDIIKPVPDRIRAEGYPAEIHEVVTDDGYVLQLHRIPYGKKSPQSDQLRPPVLLMHAIMDGANSWIALSSENSLAYLLADAGYDVWLGNARGTEPSRGHVSLSPTGKNQKDYWSFSWHEIGAKDLPAFIDHILNATKQEKLNYVGFSQGTTVFLVMASTRPEYNDKIIEAHLLGPVAYLKEVNNPLYNAIAYFYKPLKKMLEISKVYKITVDNLKILKIAEIACKKIVHSTPFACKVVLSFFSSNQINCTSLPNILVNTPSGASLQQGVHYVQLIRSGGFHQYDYENKKDNQRAYGSDTPPAYDLTKITAPVNLYHSKDDGTATFENVLRLQSQLKSHKSTYLVAIADFSHIDFTYSRYLRNALNDRLISTINKGNGK